MTRSDFDLRITWADLSGSDLCVRYQISTADGGVPSDATDFQSLAGDLFLPSHTHVGSVGDGVALRYYLISATGPFGGDGPLGHYGQ